MTSDANPAARSGIAGTTTPAPQPLSACIKFDQQGRPSLHGFKCSSCAEILLEKSRACPRCAAVGTLGAVPLADKGRLFTYTIVYRSYPGVTTPFISAIVELEGGGFIKGNLHGVEPTPQHVRFDMPVRVQYERIKSAQGSDLLRYVFVPSAEGEASR